MNQMMSFAAMGEDVVLWRALKHRSGGYFVDVGANHPIGTSVTKWFSDNGWSGVNIEPIPNLLAMFHSDRPRDLNLNVGIARQEGVLEFFQVDDDLQRSTFDVELADNYKKNGRSVSTHSIPVVTLQSIIDDHGIGHIDFLKIDAEGFEEQVIQSIDLTRSRPSVIVGEGADGQTNKWPAILEANNYRMAFFDGINRFFVADECWDELGPSMQYPACPNDNYLVYSVELERNEYMRQISELQAEANRLRHEIESKPDRGVLRRVGARIRKR